MSSKVAVRPLAKDSDDLLPEAFRRLEAGKRTCPPSKRFRQAEQRFGW
jgi:hypothetical protein